MDQSLLSDFIAETQELLHEMEAAVLRLEEDHQNRDVVDDIFRSIHTIKGSSDYLGMAEIAEIAHKLENLLDLVRQNKRIVNARLIQLLMDTRDRISQLLEAVDRQTSDPIVIDDLILEIERISDSDDLPGQPPISDNKGPIEHDRPGYSQNADEADMLSEIADDDEEIVAIFLEQFKDGYDAFRDAVIGLMTSASKEEYFSGSIAALESLRSSSNYMGYDQLCGFYEEWIELIEASKKTMVENNPFDTVAFFNTCVDPMVAKLSRWLPHSRIGFSLEIAIPDLAQDELEEVEPETNENHFISSDMFSDINADLLTQAETDSNTAHSVGDSYETLLPDEELSLDDTLTLSGESIDLLQESIDSNSEAMGEESLIEEFIDEAMEHLQHSDTALLAILEGDTSKELIDDTFRSIHTIKGSAEYLGLEKTSQILHKMESLLDLIRQGKRSADQQAIADMLAAKDLVHELVAASLDEQALIQIDITEVLDRLDLVESPADDIASETQVTTAADVQVSQEPLSLIIGDETISEVMDDFDEDYDEELFSIFLDQFDANLDTIDRILADYAPGRAIDPVLTLVLENIRNLRNSANYMGYERLCKVYDQQCDNIVAFLSGDTALDMESGNAFLKSEVQAWVLKIRSLLHPEMVSHSTDTDIASIDIGSDRLNDVEMLEEKMEGHAGVLNFSEHDALDDPVQPEMNLPESTHANDIMLFPADDLNTEEQDLFRKLESAFNSSMPGALREAPVQDHDVLRSDLFSTGQPEKTTGDVDAPIHGDVETHQLPVAEEGGLLQDMLSWMADDPSSDNPLKTLADLLPTEPVSDVTVEDSEDLSVMEEPVFRTIEDIFGSQPMSYVDIIPDEPVEPQPVVEKTTKHNIRVEASKIDLLMNQVGELVVNRSVFTQLSNDLRLLQQYFKQDLDLSKKELKPMQDLAFRLGEATVSLGRVANDLQEGVMKVRMLPISQLFNRYPRLVHDLTRKVDKKVHLDIKGADTELDRMVIEEISDPLVHIIRNAVDHGIETTAERSAAGKPELATISLTAYHESNNVVIEIIDDGKGLDIDKIRSRAIENGLIAESDAARLTTSKLVELITQPGFSTADSITHTSGRGVGMDVVKKNIEKLNGSLEIDSLIGKGTKIRIKIPLTLAIFSALLVRVENELYTVPLSAVEETIRIREVDINVVEGVEVIHLRDEPVPLLPLAKSFNKRNTLVGETGKMYAVIVNNGKIRVGLIVDSLLGQEEVVIKPLEDYLQENSGFSGATILGDGQISLILDVYELVKLTMDRKIKVAAEALI